VELLSRACDDERVSRADIPKILGKSYRQANEDGDFCRIKKLKRQGIYSKVSTLLYKGNEKLKWCARPLTRTIYTPFGLAMLAPFHPIGVIFIIYGRKLDRNVNSCRKKGRFLF
jgi:hypothetical protein